MSFGGTNLAQGHAYNRRLLLEAIRVHGALSRADLTRMTGLAPQTISNISAELIDAGLLLATRRAGGGLGQPPIDLHLNSKGGCSFGISIDNRRLICVLVDIAGNRLGELEDWLDDTRPKAVLPRMKLSMAALSKKKRIPKQRILGVGLAMTGLTTRGQFIELAPDKTTARWRDFFLENRLDDALGMPVFTDNDARAAAVGEALYGQGRKYRDFVYVYFGVGVGGSVINSGQPLRGSRGRAGEFGHMIVEPGGKPCLCGNRGCLEQYASMGSALQAIQRRTDSADPQQNLERAFAERDPDLMRWIDVAAVHLRTAVINLENIFDPQALLLGGIIPEPLLDAMIGRMGPLPRTVSSRREEGSPRIVKSTFGPAIPAMGAASLALFDATSADFSLLFKKRRPTVA